MLYLEGACACRALWLGVRLVQVEPRAADGMVLFGACCRRGCWQGRGCEVCLIRLSQPRLELPKGARESQHALVMPAVCIYVCVCHAGRSRTCARPQLLQAVNT